jgi:hypothetical protein
MEDLSTAEGVANALSICAENVLSLRTSVLGPGHLDFVGLVKAAADDHFVPDTVVMHDGQPFVYVLNARTVNVVTDEQVQSMLRLLSLRADAPYLALVRPGTVQVYALAGLSKQREPVMEAPELDPGLLAKLTTGMLPIRSVHEGRNVHDLMLDLLNAVTGHLIRVRGLAPSEALALIGRALFMRFLADRGILPSRGALPGIDSIKDCFSTPTAAFITSQWLDNTFNGDLLELPNGGDLAYFGQLDNSRNGSALLDLTAIMTGDKPLGDGAVQLHLRWDDLHFAYIPVGLLSQVYEAFAHRFEIGRAKKTSVYYTPRYLAEHMVVRAFAMLGPKAKNARILDPASGGGVFLLSAFRRLVKAHWSSDPTRGGLTTPQIRRILNEQLVGMDINPAARQLTALALYLTALELDPNTPSLKNLTFSPLQGKVLIDAASFEDHDASISERGLGSLSAAAIKAYSKKFDLVIGNPPWTAVTDEKRSNALETVSATCQSARNLMPTVANPDGVPDLPFVWAATRWAKPGAVIAFALHGRLLNKTSDAGHASRTQLFRGVEVDYLLNGTELRNTSVWPSMTAPFCLLFARNLPAAPETRFNAVTPVLDEGLNREGRVRVDSKDAWTSDLAMVQRSPWLFKALAKGNALDVELLERVNSLGYPALLDSMPGIEASHGYQTLQKGHAGMSADFLHKLPDMPKAPEATWWLVPTEKLEPFAGRLVHRRRERAIYSAPIALLRESPSSQSGRPLGMLALKDVAYSRSYIGFSCKALKDALASAVYLTAIFNSPLFLYFILMTSSKLGVERSTLQKIEAEQFPVPPLQSLSPRQRDALTCIEKAIRRGSTETERLSYDFIRDLYRLRPADTTLIRDRLRYGMPFKAARTAAVKDTDEQQTDEFCRTLWSGLSPFDMSNTPLLVQPLTATSWSPWRFLRIGGVDDTTKPTDRHLLASVCLGDMLDASLIEIPQGEALYVGILNQRRFWTSTAARTLALDLIRRSHKVLSRGTA